jgi:hypothetical protein
MKKKRLQAAPVLDFLTDDRDGIQQRSPELETFVSCPWKTRDSVELLRQTEIPLIPGKPHPS